MSSIHDIVNIANSGFVSDFRDDVWGRRKCEKSSLRRFSVSLKETLKKTENVSDKMVMLFNERVDVLSVS